MSFNNFKVNNEDNIEFDINIPLALSNSLRRTMLSEIPVMCFSDRWNDNEQERSICIKTNSTGLHNEFLAHRISHVPICMYKSDIIDKIDSYFNKTTQMREFKLTPGLSNKVFTINKKNNSDTRKEDIELINRDIEEIHLKLLQLNTEQDLTDWGNVEELIDIDDEVKSIYIDKLQSHIEYLEEVKTSNEININLTSRDIKLDGNTNTDLFRRDRITNDFILLNILKYNYNSLNDGEAVQSDMFLTVSNGLTKAQYCSVGTVSMKYNIDNDKANNIFKLKVDYINKERTEKKLDKLTGDEITKLKQSYDLLDKDRAYITDSENNPSSFNFNIESLGFIHSTQIVYDSFKLLELRLFDILTCFNIDGYNITYTDKIEIKVDNNLENEYIYIKNENHTVGNLVDYYLKEHTYKDNLLSLSSYKMPHPLEKNILFNLNLNNKYSELKLIDIYKSYFKLKQEPNTDFNVSKNIKLLILLHTICKIIKTIKLLLVEFKSQELNVKNNETFLNFNVPKNIKPLNYPSFNIIESDTKFKLGSTEFSINDTDFDLQSISINRSKKV